MDDHQRRRSVEQILETLAELPAQGVASAQVVQMAGDVDCDIRRLAQIVSGDPVLAAQVLRLANSSRFGLSRMVSDVRFAVTLIGFSTLRSLAAVNAVRSVGTTPPGFAAASTRLAVGASLLARDAGVPLDLAFITGMLSELGAAVLHSSDPAGHPGLLAGPDALLAEQARYGLDHAAAGALVLEHWQFPETLVAAVASSHHPTGDPLTQLVQGARVIASRLPGTAPHDPADLTPEPLLALGVGADRVDALVESVGDQAGDLARV